MENVNSNYAESEPQFFGKNISDLTLCYLTCPQDAAGAYMGALMITDFRARPIHFSYTSPVRPTIYQKILFASTLNPHVKIDVIAQKLLSGVPRVPDVLFVDDIEILPARQIIKKPTACLKKNISQDNNPAKLSILDYKVESNEDQEYIGQLIASLENLIDLVEPFSRMRQALKEAIKSQET
jgi:hypothetical protein